MNPIISGASVIASALGLAVGLDTIVQVLVKVAKMRKLLKA